MKIWGLGFLILLAACAETHSPQATHKELTEKTVSLQEIRVVDPKGQSVANAKILIGYEIDALPNNLITTDHNGRVNIPASWNSSQPLTIIADNFVRTTYLHQMPISKSYVIQPLRQRPNQVVYGSTTGYADLKRDDKIDFGLVLPLLPKTAFFQFDLGLFISPDSDEIEIMGRKLYVPSNVSLPDQSERYLFFNIRFNKPTYRTYFQEEGNYNLMASHGRFPFKKMIDEFQDGKGFTEVVNLFDFVEAGLHDVSAPGNYNLPIQQFRFQGTMSVKAPQIPPGFSYFASSLQTQHGLLYPADVKRMNSHETMSLKMSPLGSANVLLAAIAKEEKLANSSTRLNPSMSIAILPSIGQNALSHLPLVNSPKVSQEQILLDIPKTENFHRVGTYVALQDVKIEMTANSYNEIIIKKWEIYSNTWESQIRLPKLAETIQIENQVRWEASFLASKTSHSNATGPMMFDVAEYVSRNATDL